MTAAVPDQISENAYAVTPRQAKEYITDCMLAGLVPYLVSSPGMGKSSIAKAIAKEQNLKIIDHRLSTSAPEDLSGLPRFDEDGKARFSPFADLFPLEDTPIPEGYSGWLLLLDEFPSASKAVQAAAYKLVLDRQVGQHNLHPNVAIMAAGNKATDRAIVNPIGTAMKSRLVHLSMDIDFDEWMQDVALKDNWDKRIIAFLSQYPSKLMDFDPKNTKEATFCCPRTWEFVNKLLKVTEVNDAKSALFAGAITSGEAVTFVQFVKVFDTIVTVDDIIRNPETCRMPPDKSSSWATIATMMEHVNDDNFEKLSTYANRFDMTFQILFFRSVMIRQPVLRRHQAFSKALVKLSKYLNN